MRSVMGVVTGTEIVLLRCVPVFSAGTELVQLRFCNHDLADTPAVEIRLLLGVCLLHPAALLLAPKKECENSNHPPTLCKRRVIVSPLQSSIDLAAAVNSSMCTAVLCDEHLPSDRQRYCLALKNILKAYSPRLPALSVGMMEGNVNVVRCRMVSSCGWVMRSGTVCTHPTRRNGGYLARTILLICFGYVCTWYQKCRIGQCVLGEKGPALLAGFTKHSFAIPVMSTQQLWV